MPSTVRFFFYVLAIFLPIQTVLQQFLTNRLGLPLWLSFWKEVLAGLIMAYYLFFLGQNLGKYLKQTEQNRSNFWQKVQVFGPLVLLFVATVWITFSSFFLNKIPLKVFLLGFRFELWWLWFFVLTWTFWHLEAALTSKEKKQNLTGLSNVSLDFSWRNIFLGKMKNCLYLGFFLVSLVAISSLIWGQSEVLSHFGFQAESNLNTQPQLCHFLDAGQNLCRLSGGFSSPNHFASYLLLILPVFLIDFWQQFFKPNPK